jgi:FkbM family methyltransferase
MNFFSKKAAYLTARLAERLTPECVVGTKYGDIRFYCPSHVTVWRAETLLTKEPETIEWIDGFEKDDIFWDIGANIGCYSLYAGKKGITTCAFEPVYSNYYVLNKNIEINKLKNVSAFPVAFDLQDHMGKMHLSERTPGSALHEVANGDNPLMINQGIVAISIDTYTSRFQAGIPTHIKIDVDGSEYDILRGADRVLESPHLKSMLVELNTKDMLYGDVVAYIEYKGLKLKKKAHAAMFDGTVHANTYNHIFVR